MRATAKTSPFFRELLRIKGRAVGLEKKSVQAAVAFLDVADLCEIGTICTWEVELRWVSTGAGEVGPVFEE
jgi:hypothetical protein